MTTVTRADSATGSRLDSLTVVSPAPERDRIDATILLVGNPNTGKTALFNSLTGLRAKTANFPGTTVDYRMGEVSQGNRRIRLIDLPGIYSLDALSPEEEVTERALRGEVRSLGKADIVLLVIDSTHLERNLFLSSEVLEMGRPTVVALTLADAADKLGIEADADELAEELGCPVVRVSARRGDGIDRLRSTLCDVLERQRQPEHELPTVPSISRCGPTCRMCPYADRYDWAERVVTRCETPTRETHGKTTEAIDGILTHPVIGVLAFVSVMVGVFYLIFAMADVPMGLIEGSFATLGQQVSGLLPAGEMNSLVVDGIIGGVGGVLVFLPQICILFFFITLLEDSGYMARAAFVMEKLMRQVGLPGKAFVPMLSAHACAIPGIMATRVIESRRDRLATILVLPLVTCSARLPVYSMVAVLLFRDEPLLAALLFFAAYALGIVVALVMAFVFKKTLLKGQTRPMVIELPSYRLPSLRTALLTTWDRAKIFCKKAGTVILMISLVLWATMTYPRQAETDLPPDVSARVALLQMEADTRREQSERLSPDSAEAKRLAGEAEELRGKAETLIAQQGLEYSLAGRVGKLVEPLFRPLGFDWKINVGVVSSFAARETLVSTLAIVYGIGEQGSEDETALSETLRGQTRDDGSAIFSEPTCFSLLVFYVLAMQCLPTQAVTRRETGRWSWAIFQLGYMTVLAYVVAFATFQVASLVVGT
jgi:ferrous iron transport protein B